MSYSRLLTYGDIIPLKFTCEPDKLLKEIKDFDFKQYNPRKTIPRSGLSITSLDGKFDGIDLDSIPEYNRENNTHYTELDFNTVTDAYHKSEEIRKVVEPWKKYLGRSHVLYLPAGGYFPVHRDLPVYKEDQQSMRILIPLQDCNPPWMYFIHDGKILNFEHGRAYFVNTNKMHSLFSFRDSYMIVLNVQSNSNTYEIIGNNFQNR
tara:strand:- start:404 stop:1021 length:618 start_codon:yes stop_codon:yes gene_type:complete